jgi:hypothetical protein
MARLGLAGSSGNSSGTTAIRVPRTFEEQIEEAHGVSDEVLAEAMQEGSDSPVNALAATVVSDERSDVREASHRPPQETVIEERLMRMRQGGLGGVDKSYMNPFDAPRGFSDGGTAEEEELAWFGEDGLLFDTHSPLDWATAGLALTGAGAPVAGLLRGGKFLNSLSKAAKLGKTGIRRGLGRDAEFNRMLGRRMGAGRRVVGDPKSVPDADLVNVLEPMRGATAQNIATLGARRPIEEAAGRRAMRYGLPAAGLLGYRIGSGVFGDEEGVSPIDSPEIPETPTTPPAPDPGGTGGGVRPDGHYRHNYHDYLRDIFGDAQDEGPSFKTLSKLQLASNLFNPEVDAFHGMAELGMGEKELKQRRNANNARVALGMANITSDAALIGPLNRLREEQASGAAIENEAARVSLINDMAANRAALLMGYPDFTSAQIGMGNKISREFMEKYLTVKANLERHYLG